MKDLLSQCEVIINPHDYAVLENGQLLLEGFLATIRVVTTNYTRYNYLVEIEAG